MAVLTEISQDINSTLNLDEVLANAAGHIKRLIDYEIFAVLLREENTSNLYFRFAIGHRLEVVEHWRGVMAGLQAEHDAIVDGEEPGDNVGNVGNLAHPHQHHAPGEHPFTRRRRRRRRRRRHTPQA